MVSMLPAVAVLSATVLAGIAVAVPFQNCAARKVDAAGEKASRTINCIEDATRAGVAVDPGCLQTTEERYVAAFAEAEAKSLGLCLTLGDAGAVATLIDAFVAALTGDLIVVAGADPCAAQKLQAAREKAEGKLKCQAAAAKAGTPASEDCLRFKEQKFSKKFAGAEARYACNTTGDEAAVEDQVDGFVDQVVDAVPGGSALCTGGKFKATGARIKADLKCYDKAAGKALPVDANCLSVSATKLLSKLAKADARGPCPGGADLDADSADCVNAVVANVAGTGPCTVAKLRAAATKADKKLRCFQKATLKSFFDPDCFLAIEERFAEAFAKADAGGPCAGDAAAVETLIDLECVDEIAADLPLLPPPGSPSGAFVDG